MEALNLKTKNAEIISSPKAGCVFLVDDNPVFLSILENEIKDIFPQAKIKSFTTGEDAISNIQSEHPFLVFLDYDLAGASTTIMNGIAVLKRIKKEIPETQVVMLSGINDLKIVTTSMKHGAFDYILKGEKALNDIRHDIVNILRKFRSREEKKEHHMVNRFLIWIAVLIGVMFIFGLYHYYNPYAD